MDAGPRRGRGHGRGRGAGRPPSAAYQASIPELLTSAEKPGASPTASAASYIQLARQMQGQREGLPPGLRQAIDAVLDQLDARLAGELPTLPAQTLGMLLWAVGKAHVLRGHASGAGAVARPVACSLARYSCAAAGGCGGLGACAAHVRRRGPCPARWLV
jgi:hypothetical protein